MKKLGVIIKKAVRMFGKNKDNDVFKSIKVLEKSLIKAIETKELICKEWRNENLE